MRVSIGLSEVDKTVPGIIVSLVEDENRVRQKYYKKWGNNLPFASEKRTIETQIRRCFDDANIGRDTIALGTCLSMMIMIIISRSKG